MKKVLLISALLSLASLAMSQTDRDNYEQWKKLQQENYNSYKNDRRSQYEDFRTKANKEYAQFIRKGWEAMPVEPAIPLPKKPKPAHPIEVPPDKIPSADLIVPDDVVVKYQPQELVLPPLPTLDNPEYDDRSICELSFVFYGTPCKVAMDCGSMFQLKDFSGESLAAAWELLSNRNLDIALKDIIDLSKILLLNDWGIIDLVCKTAEAFMGGRCHESVFLSDYLLSQLGTQSTLAKSDKGLYLLVAFSDMVYNYEYVNIKGTNYYLLDKTQNNSFSVLRESFPETKKVDVRLRQVPNLNIEKTDGRTFAAKLYPGLRVTIRENKNLIDFYNKVPITENWDSYSLTSLSNECKDVLYPMIKGQMKGRSKVEGANMLLNFVQTCFDYATDKEQFGYERPLFGDESFFYPFNDCEDRAILYSILVHDILGLNVVLLEFEDHMATAVKFDAHVLGDYLDLEDGRYIVCDPTFIGAPIGVCMPQYKQSGAKTNVIQIW